MGRAHRHAARRGRPDGSLTYAQVVGVVNDASGPDDYVLTSSGGMPGELHGGWRSGQVDTAGAAAHDLGRDDGPRVRLLLHGLRDRGAVGRRDGPARTHPGGVVTTLLGDGSYLMLNSELYSAAFAGHPFVAVVCDNGGYAVIHRLQTGQGAHGFNNLLSDARPGRRGWRPRVDFAAHARVPRVHRRGRARRCVGRRPRGGVRPGPRGGRAHPPPAVVVCRTHPTDVDRGGRVLGGRRAQRAVRARGVRRAQGDPGAVAVMTPRRPASRLAPVSRRGRPGHGDPSRSPARCS